MISLYVVYNVKTNQYLKYYIIEVNFSRYVI